MGNDPVVVTRQIPGVFPLAGIVGWNLAGFKRAIGPFPRAAELLLHGRLDPRDFFPGFRERNDYGVTMINPYTCVFLFHIHFQEAHAT
jgi:hypothetical protein